MVPLYFNISIVSFDKIRPQDAAHFGERRDTCADFFQSVVRQSFQTGVKGNASDFVQIAACQNQRAQIFIDAQDFMKCDSSALTRPATFGATDRLKRPVRADFFALRAKSPNQPLSYYAV